MRTERNTGFIGSLKKNLRGMGESIVEARRRQNEYHRRHPGFFE